MNLVGSVKVDADRWKELKNEHLRLFPGDRNQQLGSWHPLSGKKAVLCCLPCGGVRRLFDKHRSLTPFAGNDVVQREDT